MLKGNILKMHSTLLNPIDYTFIIGENKIFLNELINKQVSIEWTGKINCINCGRITSKSFFQGHCYPCFSTIPQTDECVLNPEKCKAHLGISRDIEWAKSNCLTNHVVYLSFTDKVKVGVTRENQIPTRWIDQGAIAVATIAITPNRFIAGSIEVALKSIISDKTSWQKMLSIGNVDKSILATEINNAHKIAIQHIAQEYKKWLISEISIKFINYPIINAPLKPKSVNLENSTFKGRLSAIKGQYLILETNEVINIRKYGGYEVIFNVL